MSSGPNPNPNPNDPNIIPHRNHPNLTIPSPTHIPDPR